MEDQGEAVKIAEDLLTRTGEAMLAGDYDRFFACVALPILTESFSGQRWVETEQECRTLFEEAHKYYSVNNVTDLVRKVVSASFTDDSTIHSTHEARCLSGRIMLQHHTNCLSRIRLIDGTWRIDLVRYASENAQQFDDIFGDADMPSAARPEFH